MIQGSAQYAVEKTSPVAGSVPGRDRIPICFVFGLSVCLWVLVSAAAPLWQEEEGTEKLHAAQRAAVILWIGLGALSVFVVGVGLIWGVRRGARRVLRKRDPVHTEMPNIWYLNPPGKRRQDDS